MPITPSRASRSSSALRQAEHAAQHLLVVLAERCRRRPHRDGCVSHAIGRRRLRMAADIGALDPLPEAPRLEMRIVDQLDRDGAPRRPPRPRAAESPSPRQANAAASRPRPRARSRLPVRGVRAVRARIVQPMTRASAVHIASSVDGDEHPFVGARRRKDAVRLVERMAVAGARRDAAGGRLLDRPGGRERQHALDLGEIDELALPRPLAMQQRDQHGRAGIEAADGVAEGEMVHHRRIVGPAGDARQAGALLERRAVGARLLPRAGAAEGRHRDHDQRRIHLGELGIVEAELAQHLGGVVLDHRVGALHQRLGERHAVGHGEVERDRALAAIHDVEARATSRRAAASPSRCGCRRRATSRDSRRPRS